MTYRNILAISQSAKISYSYKEITRQYRLKLLGYHLWKALIKCLLGALSINIISISHWSREKEYTFSLKIIKTNKCILRKLTFIEENQIEETSKELFWEVKPTAEQNYYFLFEFICSVAGICLGPYQTFIWCFSAKIVIFNH